LGEIVTDGSDVPGDWDPSGQAEPPAALLRRAISHVEQLLGRLEHAGAPDTATVALPIGSTLTQRDTRTLDGALEPMGLASPVRGISSSSQAEALRVSLSAHERANRLLAESSAIRAQSAAEGERVLSEARDLADRVQIEARDEAREECGRLRTEAATEAQATVQSAQQEAERLRNDAAAEAHRVVESAQQDAARLRREAADEVQALRDTAQQTRSAAEDKSRAEHDGASAAIREVLDNATRDSEQIRVQARIQARLDAALEVETALAQARSAVDADRLRIQDMLHAATASVVEVRMSMRAVTDALGHSMARVDGAASSVEVLLGRFETSAGMAADAATQRNEGLGVAEQRPSLAGSGPDSERHPAVHNADAHNGADGTARYGAGHNGDDDGAALILPEQKPADHDQTHRPLGSLFGGSRKPRSPKR
jgi:hypothetical protein